jgi:hypothetical protein
MERKLLINQTNLIPRIGEAVECRVGVVASPVVCVKPVFSPPVPTPGHTVYSERDADVRKARLRWSSGGGLLRRTQAGVQKLIHLSNPFNPTFKTRLSSRVLGIPHALQTTHVGSRSSGLAYIPAGEDHLSKMQGIVLRSHF